MVFKWQCSRSSYVSDNDLFGAGWYLWLYQICQTASAGLGLSVLTRKTSKVISMTSQNKGVLAPKNASRFFYLDFASDWLGGWLEISEQRQKEEKEKNRNIFT